MNTANIGQYQSTNSAVIRGLSPNNGFGIGGDLGTKAPEAAISMGFATSSPTTQKRRQSTTSGAIRWDFGAGLFDDAVDAAPAVVLLGLNGEAQPFLQSSSQRAAHRVSLPAERFDNLRD